MINIIIIIINLLTCKGSVISFKDVLPEVPAIIMTP